MNDDAGMSGSNGFVPNTKNDLGEKRKMTLMNHRFASSLLIAGAVSLLGMQEGIAQSTDLQRGIYVQTLDHSGAHRVLKGRKRALIVSVNRYDDKRIGDLRFCDQDGRRIFQTLTKDCGFDKKDVFLLSTQANLKLPPTTKYIQKVLKHFVASSRPSDTVLVFFSGHGYLQDGQGFLLTKECRLDNIANTSISTQYLRQRLSACAARSKLLVLDCCHAGGKGFSKSPDSETLAQEFKQTAGLLTIASCRAGEKSYEWATKRQGLFTHFFAQGLEGEADPNRDGIVNSTELYNYVRQNTIQTAALQLNAQQTPVLIVRGEVPVFALARTATVFKPIHLRGLSFDRFGRKLPQGWAKGPFHPEGRLIIREGKMEGNFFIEFTARVQRNPNRGSFSVRLLANGENPDIEINGSVLNHWSDNDTWSLNVAGKQIREAMVVTGAHMRIEFKDDEILFKTKSVNDRNAMGREKLLHRLPGGNVTGFSQVELGLTPHAHFTRFQAAVLRD